MTTRRTFLLNVMSFAALPIIPKSLSLGAGIPDELKNALGEEVDPIGHYIAVAREAEGSVTLSEIINNRLKERETIPLGDMDAIIEFIDRVGLGRIQFIDWHAERKSDDISVHELQLDWNDGILSEGLRESFNDCANLLACPMINPET